MLWKVCYNQMKDVGMVSGCDKLILDSCVTRWDASYLNNISGHHPMSWTLRWCLAVGACLEIQYTYKIYENEKYWYLYFCSFFFARWIFYSWYMNFIHGGVAPILDYLRYLKVWFMNAFKQATMICFEEDTKCKVFHWPVKLRNTINQEQRIRTWRESWITF